jgi:hypothetical protein
MAFKTVTHGGLYIAIIPVIYGGHHVPIIPVV